MQKIITYENLRSFAYSNDHLIQGKIRGIVLRFQGLGNGNTYGKDPAEALEYAREGIVYVIPYNNPWCWMNAQAVSYTDEIVSVLRGRYGLGEDVKIVSTGQSMGGLGALVYMRYAQITPAACVANCPVCDLVYHFTEREDLPRTLYSAYANDAGSLDEALRAHSPLHLADQMPPARYTVFHCCMDEAVNKQMHSDRFVEAMRKDHDITYIQVPLRGHCDLSPQALIQFREAVLEAFEE